MTDLLNFNKMLHTYHDNEVIGSLIGLLPLNPKKVSTIKQVVSFSTDKNSAKESVALIEKLNEYKSNLPIEIKDLKPENIENNLNTFKKNIENIDLGLKFIDDVFGASKFINAPEYITNIYTDRAVKVFIKCDLMAQCLIIAIKSKPDQITHSVYYRASAIPACYVIGSNKSYYKIIA